MHGSGDVALAFSTTNKIPHYPQKSLIKTTLLSDFWMDPLFEMAADAAEESLLNALLAARTMKGRGGNQVYEIPIDRLKKALKIEISP